MSEDTDEMITFAQVEKLTGHKRSTLTAAARVGTLKAHLEPTLVGIPVWVTTLQDVTEWASKRRPGVGRPAKKV